MGPTFQNPMEKNKEHEMETGFCECKAVSGLELGREESNFLSRFDIWVVAKN